MSLVRCAAVQKNSRKCLRVKKNVFNIGPLHDSKNTFEDLKQKSSDYLKSQFVMRICMNIDVFLFACCWSLKNKKVLASEKLSFESTIYSVRFNKRIPRGFSDGCNCICVPTLDAYFGRSMRLINDDQQKMLGLKINLVNFNLCGPFQH